MQGCTVTLYRDGHVSEDVKELKVEPSGDISVKRIEGDVYRLQSGDRVVIHKD